jgi:hypothetical protein
MTREFEPDPEVIADLRLRESTSRDASRTRIESYAWSPPAIVAKWRCRNAKCKSFADVPEDAMEALCTFNAQLRARGEEPLETNLILYCDPCLAEFKATAATRRRAQVERMAVVIKQLKESRDPERERDLIAQLEKWGHPDVAGLVQAITERRSAESGRVGKKRSI